MGEYKRKFGIYSAWNYELEIEDLNEMSAKGWQLIRGGGLFSNKYKKNTEIRYRYQLDFQPNIEDKGRYIETFREQGWEYINSTFNGWHYFRKLYDATKPEEAYEIFTDKDSKREMNNRWAIVGMVLSAILVMYLALHVLMLIVQPKLITLVRMIYLGVILAVLLRGVMVMRKQGASRKSRLDKLLMPMFFVWVIFGAVIMVSLTEARPYYANMKMQAEYYGPVSEKLEEASNWCGFAVNYPDNYYLGLKVDAEVPICISLVDEAGEVVYTVTTAEFEEENIRLWLKNGNYFLNVSDFAGGAIDLTANLK